MPIQDKNQECNPFDAKWSAQGHTLCLGHWQIKFNGVDIELPSVQKENHMDTRGIFSFLFPDDMDYIEGSSEDEWILNNVDWLSDVFEQYEIPIDEQHMRWFYQAVSLNDWRCGSCGGCI